MEKKEFQKHLVKFTSSLRDLLCDQKGQWSVRGFIDNQSNIYTISSDTKIVSKISPIFLHFLKAVSLVKTPTSFFSLSI